MKTEKTLIKKTAKKSHVITTTHEFIINNSDFGYDFILIYRISNYCIYGFQINPLPGFASRYNTSFVSA